MEGDRVETIKKDCHHKSEAIVLGILWEWVRKQATPGTWKNLVDILIKCNLQTLVEDVHNTHTTKETKETFNLTPACFYK